MRRGVRERLNARLIRDEATGCLLWQGHLSLWGYGRIAVNGRTQSVHRVAWELENGPIPDGLEIDHVLDRGCVHKHCCNTAHLEPVTHLVNNSRKPYRPRRDRWGELGLPSLPASLTWVMPAGEKYWRPFAATSLEQLRARRADVEALAAQRTAEKAS